MASASRTAPPRAPVSSASRNDRCWRGWTALLLLALGLAPGSARAEGEGAFFEPEALPAAGFELRVRASYYTATRTGFTTPVLLFPDQPLRLAVEEVRLSLDLRLALTPRLGVQAIVPLSARFAKARLDGVIVSRSEQLPAVDLSLHNAGLADTTLLLAYRVFQSDAVDAYLEGGTRVAMADNPEGQTLPSTLPMSTGQAGLLIGGGSALRSGVFAVSAAYRFEYDPGNATTYLVRWVGAQAYTSGSLSARSGHRVVAQLAWAVAPWFSARLTPEWTAFTQPRLLSLEGERTLVKQHWLEEVALALELRFALSEAHALAIDYREPLLHSWNDDPFFPIAIPARGIGVTWLVRGW